VELRNEHEGVKRMNYELTVRLNGAEQFDVDVIIAGIPYQRKAETRKENNY